MKYSQDTINQLNSVPLTDVMEHFGHSPVRRTKKAVFYLCPFHSEEDASFKVDMQPNGRQKQGDIQLCGYYCYACSEEQEISRGYGALMLTAALMKLDLKVAGDLDRAVTELGKIGNLTIDGDPKNGFFHRAKRAEHPSDEIILRKRDGFTNRELRSLGCEVTQLFRMDYNTDSEQSVTDCNGLPTYRYAWGEVDAKVLHEQFSLYALEGFTTEQRDGKSYDVQATDTYPIFAFLYEDEQGWWAKKYEPLFKPTIDKETGEAGPNYKFTWWYQGGRRRDEEMGERIYGDRDVMRALAGEQVQTSDMGHPVCFVKERRGEQVATVTKFRRIILCSGPRDGLNVYFHSDAHVCWPHSEGSNIPPKVVKRLREIAAEVIVLYDIDRTGRERADKLTLDHLELKTIYLPEELMKMRSSRTGKPCKDVEEYFNYYPSILREERKTMDIDSHFRSLVKSAKEKMFWRAVPHRRKNEWGEEVIFYRYELLIDRMCQFLAAMGLHRYRKGDVTKFVYISEGNKVDIIPDKEVENKAKEIMKSYLNESLYYGDEGLMNAISTARGLNTKTLSEIPLIELDFRAWGEDFDYFHFGNCNVRVSADEIRKVPYSQMKYPVNRAAILQDVYYEYSDMSRYFSITENPSLEMWRKRYKAEIYGLKGEELKRKRQEMKEYESLNKYLLVRNKPIEEWPPLLQTIYNMSRTWWKKEDAGYPLSAKETQFQDAHFINKILGLGYMLSRYRTDTRQQMVMVTDYSVAEEGKASGRNGKTLFAGLLNLVRINKTIPGKDYRKDPGSMAKNFSNFKLTVHSAILIDDLNASVDADSFYNNTSSLSVRNLYEDTVQIAPEETPKMILTMNNPFNLAEPSTYGRTWPIFLSDYYHEESMDGEMERRTPETEFGYDILKSCPPDERTENINLMLYCLQCYLRFIRTDKGVMRPPVGDEVNMRLAYQDIHDKRMVMWANQFFANEWHFGRPVSIREMILDYYDSIGIRVTRNEITARMNNFKSELKNYCIIRRFSINPDVVYSANEDRRRGVVRRVTWITEFGEDGYPVEPRVRRRGGVGKSNPECWYFYRWGDEPKENSHVLNAPTEKELQDANADF
ncbi:MAG: hypothetical protein ACI36Z_03150 [Alloprevotella sp.]